MLSHVRTCVFWGMHHRLCTIPLKNSTRLQPLVFDVLRSLLRWQCVGQLSKRAMAAAAPARPTAQPTPSPAPFCSWLIEDTVLISSYLDAQVRLIHFCKMKKSCAHGAFPLRTAVATIMIRILAFSSQVWTVERGTSAAPKLHF